MLTATSSTDSESIKEWLRAMRLVPTPVGDPLAHWRFDFKYPHQTSLEMSVLNPKAITCSVCVAHDISIGAEYLVNFERLAFEQQMRFAFDLQLALNRDHVEFALIGVAADRISCPSLIQVASSVYDGAITLDTVASRLLQVFNAQLAAVLCIQRYLAPKRKERPRSN